MRKARQDCFDEGFGFGAGNKYIFCYMKCEAVEFLGSNDVLDGFEVETALDEALDGGLLVAVDRAFGVCEQGGAIDGERVHEEDGGVGDRGGAEVGVGGELAGGAG